MIQITKHLNVKLTPTLFHPNFWGVPVGPDRRCWGKPEQEPSANQPWNYFRSIPTYVITVPQCQRQTDWQTDRWTDWRLIKSNQMTCYGAPHP